MIDFTSALYLGLGHASGDLRPWVRLTTGTPAALRPTPGSAEVGRAVAELQGLEAGMTMRSTLHAFWDLLRILTRDDYAVHVDGAAYPIGIWGAWCARASGARVTHFHHYDTDALRRGMNRHRPVILTDGFCPGCGRAAPLVEYAAIASRHGGLVIVDDTQALGVLGSDPTVHGPLGRGGGGTLRALQATGPTVCVASLAKGFGSPLCVVSGSEPFIARLRAESSTKVHSSQPTSADVASAQRALSINARDGDALRMRLTALVSRLRRGLGHERGIPFPAVGLHAPIAHLDELHARLGRAGIRTVMSRQCRGPQLSLLVTARHTRKDIDAVLGVLTASRLAEAVR